MAVKKSSRTAPVAGAKKVAGRKQATRGAQSPATRKILAAFLAELSAQQSERHTEPSGSVTLFVASPKAVEGAFRGWVSPERARTRSESVADPFSGRTLRHAAPVRPPAAVCTKTPRVPSKHTRTLDHTSLVQISALLADLTDGELDLIDAAVFGAEHIVPKGWPQVLTRVPEPLVRRIATRPAREIARAITFASKRLGPSGARARAHAKDLVLLAKLGIERSEPLWAYSPAERA